MCTGNTWMFEIIDAYTKGSHHIYYREDIPEIVNIQPNGSKAKPYQVKQVRQIIVKYKLGGDLNV